MLSMAERLGEVRTVKGAIAREDIGSRPKRCCAPRTARAWCSRGHPRLRQGHAPAHEHVRRHAPEYDAGLSDHLTKWELSDAYREAYLQEQKIVPHEMVDDGPVLENVMMGDDVDVTQFPAPKWHEKDGGRYIGTGTTPSPATRRRTGSTPERTGHKS